MKSFFTARQRRLMGLPEPEEPHVPPPNLPPRCCDKAIAERCYCEASRWSCPEHGTHGQACNPNLSHD